MQASLQAFLEDLPESPSDPVDPSDIVDDHLSILSSFSSCVCTEAQAPSLGNGYNSNPFLSDYRSGNMHWNTERMELDLNSGSTISLPCSTVPIGLHMIQCSFDSPRQPHPGPNVPVLPYPGSLSLSEAVEGQVVPLCSVRFGRVSGGDGGENLEGLQWCNL